MSDQSRVKSRLLAYIKALLPSDWRGRAGKRFRDSMEVISDFSKGNDLSPRDIAAELVRLGRTKLEGSANKEYAAAVKDFAEAEDKRIEAELKRRSIESEVRKKEAEARKTEIENLKAELELIKTLKELRCTVRLEHNGHLTVLPTSQSFDELKDRLLKEVGTKTEDQQEPDTPVL